MPEPTTRITKVKLILPEKRVELDVTTEGQAPARHVLNCSGVRKPIPRALGSVFGSTAKTDDRLFALLAAIAVRAEKGGPNRADVLAAPGWEGVGEGSVEGVARKLLGGAKRLKWASGRVRFTASVTFEFKPTREDLERWLWPNASTTGLVQKIAALYRSGDKQDRKDADHEAHEAAREKRLTAAWLVEELRNGETSREERAVMVAALGAHPDAGDTELEVVLDQLRRARADGTVYAYRVLFAARALLTKGCRVREPIRYLEELIHIEEAGGKESSIAAKSVRRMLISMAAAFSSASSLRDELVAVRDALGAGDVAGALSILERLLRLMNIDDKDG